MKLSVVNNRFFSSVAVVKTVVNKFTDEINKVLINTIDRLCVRM